KAMTPTLKLSSAPEVTHTRQVAKGLPLRLVPAFGVDARRPEISASIMVGSHGKPATGKTATPTVQGLAFLQMDIARTPVFSKAAIICGGVGGLVGKSPVPATGTVV